MVKLANVALSMLWGFAVTFVFVRALPGEEFRAFLLLVAFNNFTISAEFGLTNIVYSRLRRFWLGDEPGGEQGFRREEIGVLFLFLGGLIVISSLLVVALIALGWIDTQLPAIFLIFFLAAALNVLLLLAKRTLAAMDCNLQWEVIDIARRVLGLMALFAVLGGFSLLHSVAVQLLLNAGGALIGMKLIHSLSGMRLRQWFAYHVGGGHIRSGYLRDIGASATLTASEIIAYNAPYFLIAALSSDPRLLLIFDFVFKIIRSVGMAIRATIEAVLPVLTRYWFARDRKGFARVLMRAGGVALGIALCANLLLVAIGQTIFGFLYDGATLLRMGEMFLLCTLLFGLAVMCVSGYVQMALGRFSALLRCSLPFMLGCLLVTPLATRWLPVPGEGDAFIFMLLYTSVFMGGATLHLYSLVKLKQIS